MEEKNAMEVLGSKLTIAVKSLIADAVGDITGNDMEMISSVIRRGKLKELDKIVRRIEKHFIWYTREYDNLPSSCYYVTNVEINIFIRLFLSEQVEYYEKHAKTTMKEKYCQIEEAENTIKGEKYCQIEEAENNLKILKELVSKFEGTSTDWQDIVFRMIRDSENKTLIMIAGWLFV